MSRSSARQLPRASRVPQSPPLTATRTASASTSTCMPVAQCAPAELTATKRHPGAAPTPPGRILLAQLSPLQLIESRGGQPPDLGACPHRQRIQMAAGHGCRSRTPAGGRAPSGSEPVCDEGDPQDQPIVCRKSSEVASCLENDVDSGSVYGHLVFLRDQSALVRAGVSVAFSCRPWTRTAGGPSRVARNILGNKLCKDLRRNGLGRRQLALLPNRARMLSPHEAASESSVRDDDDPRLGAGWTCSQPGMLCLTRSGCPEVQPESRSRQVG